MGRLNGLYTGACLDGLGDRIAHIGVPGHSSVHFFLGKEHGWLDAIFGVDGVLEDFILLIGAQARGLQAIPEKEV